MDCGVDSWSDQLISEKIMFVLKIFGAFSVIAIMPIIAISLSIGFINFNYEMLNPQMWSEVTREGCAAWVTLIYGIFFMLWAKHIINHA